MQTRTSAVPRSSAIAVAIQDARKKFGRALALDGANFELRYGEIHALLGENGAGKTSLMNVLAGLYRAESGRVMVNGRPSVISSPEDAKRLGIGMVHQEQRLVGRFTAAENVVLGHANPRWFTPPGYFHRFAAELSRRHTLSVDSETPVSTMPLGRRQRVELVKLLHHGARIIILDEPTANLAPLEVSAFFSALRGLTESGDYAVVFITHKLDEVAQYTDRVTVMRAGQTITTLPTAETTRELLNQLMVGETGGSAEVADADVVRDLVGTNTAQSAGNAVLRVENLFAPLPDGSPGLEDVSMTLRSGEVLALVGVAGNGQTQFAEAITGHLPGFRGCVEVVGRSIRGLSARAVHELGVAHIPEDRREVGLVPGLSVAMNLALRNFDRSPYSRGGWLDEARIRERAVTLIARYGIRPADPDLPAGKLSGGNQQRVIVARELATNPRLVVADNFTRGLDPASAQQFTRELFAVARSTGAGVIWITGDLSEAMLCDRIAVFFRGRLNGLVRREDARREQVGMWMSSAATLGVGSVPAATRGERDL